MVAVVERKVMRRLLHLKDRILKHSEPYCSTYNVQRESLSASCDRVITGAFAFDTK